MDLASNGFTEQASVNFVNSLDTAEMQLAAIFQPNTFTAYDVALAVQ